MKRFTLILSLMVAMVTTAMAQITSLDELSNEKTYVIQSKRCWLAYYEANPTKLCTTNANNWEGNLEATNNNLQFKILKEDGAYYLFSVAANKYVTKSGEFSDTKDGAFNLTDHDRYEFRWLLTVGGNGLNTQIPGQYAEGIVVNSWANADDGNLFNIIDVETYKEPVYVSDLKDFKQNKAYTLTTKQRGAWTVNSKLTELTTTAPTGKKYDANDTKQQFAVLTVDNENYYLFNVAAGKFVKAKYDLVQEKGTPIKLNNATAEGAYRMQIQYVGDTDGYFNIGGSNQRDICGWSAIDHGNAVLFTEVADFDPAAALAMLNEGVVEITYNFTYNGQPLNGYTQTVKAYVDEEYPDITVALPFGITATKPAGTIAADAETTVTIALEENLPFVYAASYDAITNWYYVKNKGEFYLSHVENQGNIALGNDQKIVDAGNKDAFSWAFVGNPFDGFQFVNKAAGKGYVLSSTTSITDDANTFPVMTATPIADGSNELWVLTASTYQENGFFVAQKGFASNRMNNRGNKLAYWTGGADNGSTFTVELRNDDEELLAALAEAQELVNSITGEGVGYATSASIKAVQDAIDAKDLVALQAAVAALETIQPEEGKFYYIASAMPSTDARSGQKMYVNNDGAMQFQNAETLGNVFQFVPAGDNTFYLYNVERGTYLNTAKGHNGGQATAVATTGSVKVSVANMGRENVVSIIPNGGAMLHAQAAGSQVVAWNNTDNAGASAWKISEVAGITEHSHEITVGEAGYATLCLGYNAAIPTLECEEGEECGVYTATVVDGYAAMTKVEGVLPANTAVIVKAAAGTYEFKYATGEATTIENNELKGTTINANITEDAYVLGYINVAEEGEEERKEVGLYTAEKNKLDNTAWLNNAFKAYLPAPANSEDVKSLSFRFGKGTTAIENVEVENEVKAIFDLAGRRVEAITAPGIYIVGGKKVLVK